MHINIDLDKNFEYVLNKLKKKYGEDFAKLNGISEGQLDLSEFIDKKTFSIFDILPPGLIWKPSSDWLKNTSLKTSVNAIPIFPLFLCFSSATYSISAVSPSL